MTTPAPLESGTGAVEQLGSCDHGTATRQVDTSSRTLRVEVGSRRTSWLYGGRIRQLLKVADVPTMWDPARREYAVATDRVDDVLVVAEHTEHRFVTVSAVAQ